MNIEEIVKLINSNNEAQIPRDVPYDLVQEAYKLSTRNSMQFSHALEKVDNEKYGYLGVLRLRDVKYTHKYVTEQREKIVEIAKSKPTKLEQVATIYIFLVNNFTLNFDYDKSFKVYYKSIRDIFDKSDSEITKYFEDIKEYSHPFREVEIDGEKYIACTRSDLYETKTSLEGIISEEFLLLCSKVNPKLNIDNTFCRLKDSNKTYGLFSVNISNNEDEKKFTLMSPTLDILNKQLTGMVEYNNFGLSNEDAKVRYDYINKLENQNVSLSKDEITLALSNSTSFELND